jgi:hypothetical protein
MPVDAPPKRYVNRVGVEVTYEELSEIEQDWYSLTSPLVSLSEWCRECEADVDDTARWPTSS